MVTAYIVYTFSHTRFETNYYALLEPHCEFRWRKYNSILFQTKKSYLKFAGKRERV